MNIHRNFLAVFFWLIAISLSAQDFKVIEETKDYILKECDSIYFHSHGIDNVRDFIIDSIENFKDKGVLKLPLSNGKFFEIKDSSIIINHEFYIIEFYYEGRNKYLGKYLFSSITTKVGCPDGDTYDNYFVNINDGKVELLENFPWVSPLGINIAFDYVDDEVYPCLLLKNLKTKRKFLFMVDRDNMGGFKWIDDYSFLYRKSFEVSWFENANNTKYYLVQIKQ